MIVEINKKCVLYIKVLRDDSQLNCLPQCYRNTISPHFVPTPLNGKKMEGGLSIQG